MASFEEMGRWLHELKANIGDDIIIHVVGTKSDIVAQDPSRRQVPYERCISYVADRLYPSQTTPANAQAKGWGNGPVALGSAQNSAMTSPKSNRSSGFWGQEIGWDCCHEISAKDGEGVDEVFRVITRKLVEQHQRRFEDEQRQLFLAGLTPGVNGHGAPNGYFDAPSDGNASFRIGMGDKRRSWLGFPTTPLADNEQNEWEQDVERVRKNKGGKCC